MTHQERADWFLNQFEQTCMGFSGGRYSDPNHVRGMRMGIARRLLEKLFKDAVAEETQRVLEIIDDERKTHCDGFVPDYTAACNNLETRIRGDK
jgi:predicted phosphoadenosine phosphosulfate sulfurtransferase